MAMMMDQQQQQQSHKHHCRICKKGFGCGRALGGHMRAHGINDDPFGEQGDGADDDPSACGSDWADDKLSPPATHRRMYALRTNPHRLRTCRACENCGKEFSSWKAFLEHGRCASPGGVDPGDESMVSSPRSDGAGGVAEDDDPAERRGCMGWSKGKRSRRTKVAGAGASSSYCLSSQEEDLANCLVMLSAGRVEPMAAVETEESCASASKEEDRRNPAERSAALPAVEKPKPSAAAAPPRGMFECKACKKVFSSHQALGGHRASHKKVKGCFAARLDDLDESPPEEEVITRDHAAAMAGADESTGPLAIVPFDQAAPPGVAGAPPLKIKSKLHECSICHRVFTSGQALGGHKRCHWITSNAAPDPASMAKLHQMQAHAQAQHQQLLQLRPMFDKSEPLDLNLPAPADDVARARPELEAPLSLDVPALFLQPWTDGNTNIKHHHSNNNNNSIHTNSNTNYNNNSNNNNTCKINDVDDEADSKIKLAKLSDLKDLNMGGDSSSWLQVGIGSSTKTGREP